MPKATATLKSSSTPLAEADSSSYKTVEGNIYFPPSSLTDKSVFKPSNTHTTCPWKGVASYYNVDLGDGKVVKDAAWYYPDVIKGKGAEPIEGFVAFCKFGCFL